MMNDARNKLRSMGGIMASSPELMQAAAQRFNNGGIAMTTAPMGPPLPAMQYNDVMRSQMEPPVVGLGRVTPPPVRPAGLPEDITAELMAGSSAIYPPEQQNTRDILSLPEVIVGAVPYRVDVEAGRVFRNDGSPVRGAEAEAALKQAPEALYTAERATSSAAERRARKKLEANQARLQELQEEKIGGVAPSSAAAEEEAALVGEINALGNQLGSFASAEDTVMSMPLTPATEQTFKDLVPKRAQDDPAEAEKIAQDAMSVLAKRAPVANTDTDTDTGGQRGPGTQRKPKQRQSLRAAFKENLGLIKDLYGIDDEDQARDRMMNLAMMGLAIASGTSPNALTNIAQGLAVGAQGFAASAAQRREREQGIREAALDLTLSERAAEDAFIRGQMEADQEFIRDLALTEAEKGAPKLYSDTASTVKTPFGEFEVFKATRQGFEEGLQDKFKAPDEVVAAYEREMSEKNRVLGMLSRSQQLLKDNPDQIAGLGGAFARAVTSLGNAFGIDTPNLTPSQEYDTIMTQLATELAPIILGESGRTISDGDRARVAEALGFVVDKTSIGGDPGISVTGFVQTAVSDPEKLSFALESISKRLGEAYEPATGFMKKYFPDKLKQEPAGEAVEVDGNTYTVREVT